MYRRIASYLERLYEAWMRFGVALDSSEWSVFVVNLRNGIDPALHHSDKVSRAGKIER